MPDSDFPNFSDFRSRKGEPPGRHLSAAGLIPRLVAALLIAAVLYGAYVWFIKRQVVGPDEVLVLLKKNGTRGLPDGQIIIPREPEHGTKEWEPWNAAYGNCNGIKEEVYTSGTYFGFSPFDYERMIIKIKETADVPPGKVGILVKKFGKPLPAGQVLADESLDQRGPLPRWLEPGRHFRYANPYAYDIIQVDPVQVDPGHRGVVTVMAGQPAVKPNSYLVETGEQGVQRQTEPEGFLYINPYEKRITPISIRSQRFEMAGAEAIQFPSSDSFDIRLEGFVEWSIMPDRLPETYAKYSEGSELIPLVEKTMILPYARSYSRLVGSQYNARDFISGETKLKFQAEFEAMLREACAEQGVEILQALVRDIIPPEAIKEPINEREIAKEQILQYEQQIKVADSMAKLATQEEMSNQNNAIGDANKEVVTVVKMADQIKDVAVTKALQDLEVAKLRLEAAKNQAQALVSRGQAEAEVILLQRKAEAEPLRQQVAAFGSGNEYARYFFYQKIAPAIQSILTNSDGPFADMFKQFTSPQPATVTNRDKVSGVNSHE